MLGKIGECGMQVCRESCGSAKTFQCFYHAWTFDKQGRLIGVPGEDAYSAAFNREGLGLASPPRVEICKDEWRFQEWLALLTEDATYEVPSTDTPDGDSRTALFIIADNIERIRSRVHQLLGKSAWAENPPSRTRRLIGDVRSRELEGDPICVTANFAVYRTVRSVSFCKGG